MAQGERLQYPHGSILIEAAAEEQQGPRDQQVLEQGGQRLAPVELRGIGVAVVLGVLGVGEHAVGARAVVAMQLPEQAGVDVKRLRDLIAGRAAHDLIESPARVPEDGLQHVVEVGGEHRTGSQRRKRSDRRVGQHASQIPFTEGAADGVLERERAQRVLQDRGGLFVLPLREPRLDSGRRTGRARLRAQEAAPFGKAEGPRQTGAHERMIPWPRSAPYRSSRFAALRGSMTIGAAASDGSIGRLSVCCGSLAIMAQRARRANGSNGRERVLAFVS